jgi:predicted ATPase
MPSWGIAGKSNFAATRGSHSALHESLRLVKSVQRARDGFFLRAESLFNVASEIEHLDEEPSTAPPIIDSYGGRSLHEQSHGESFFAVMMNRFGGRGFYVLDEPEAALSPSRQLAMIARLHELVRARSQFVIATHSPILMAYPNAWIYQITEHGLRRVRLEETEHYVIARRFLNDPHGQIAQLLG